jgi:adenylate kinase family enzyme
MEPLNPPESGKCERGVCKIVTRNDDSKEVITKRMVEYEEKTAPLLNVYKSRGIVIDFEPKRGVKDYDRLLGLI